MPSTPCRSHRCPNLVNSRLMKGYCDEHSAQRSSWSRNNKNKMDRLTGRPWRRLRARVLERDGYLCQTCERKSIVEPATEVDHVKNIASGGTDDMSNLESICTPCHKRKTFLESQQGRLS